MTENEALELAKDPHKIIDPETCNLVLGYLNGAITDVAMEEFDLENQANNHHFMLIGQEGRTVAYREAEYKVSEPYKKWKAAQLELRKLRGFKSVLRKKEELLQSSNEFIRKNYGNYPRTI